jgi:2-polyprenyl-3-methyl-5-hydroxy-6-metoxy-1,4-benzoquinol methylase
MSLPVGYFDELYAGDDDPWGFERRWYERRKYALTLAALSRERYASAFEPGCSVGVLTAALADRCDRLLAVDAAAAPVATARARLADRPHVRVEQRAVPAHWPAGRFDLVVLSEVGYYLDPADLALLVTAAAESLDPGGDLVAVHWRYPVDDYPLRGDAVHAALAARPELARTCRHVEADFLLEVYARTPAARSVAQVEGLC